MSATIVGLGEVLWDLFPSGKVLGGAPFNFTFHCHQLGQQAVMVSRVGRDVLGTEVRAVLHELGLGDEFMQDDPEHATGTVAVAVDAQGQPTFTINEGAWDHLAWDDQLAVLAGRAQVVCFGSLVQRNPTARATVQRFLQSARNALLVFDVNLRQHYHSRDVLEESLRLARWAKLNDAELVVLRDLFGLAGSEQSKLVLELRSRFDLETRSGPATPSRRAW
jgi:fructokinase